MILASIGIKDDEDTQMLQNDLHKLYKSADTNNSKFNALQYGKVQQIKSATTYKLYDSNHSHFNSLYYKYS